MTTIFVSARLTSLATALLLAATGCATAGGNVKGDFDCSAPDGICAPTSVIDDRALAMISGDVPLHAELPVRTSRKRTIRPIVNRVTVPSAVRSGERVLRIVFPAHVDDEGMLHEAAAVRAVVDPGHWQPAGMPQNAPTSTSDSLAEVVDRVNPPGVTSLAADPGLPDATAVAAARARLDPIAAIKADVDRRLRVPSLAPATRPIPNKDAKVPGCQSAKGSGQDAPTAASPRVPPEPVLRAKSFPGATGEDK